MSSRYNTDGMLVFPGSETEPIMNPLESIACTIAFDVRDWFEDRRSAWIYCIVFGLEDDTELRQMPGGTRILPILRKLRLM